jgi:hypothetical protein
MKNCGDLDAENIIALFVLQLPLNFDTDARVALEDREGCRVEEGRVGSERAC